MKTIKSKLVIIIPLILLISAIVFAAVKSISDEENIIVGMVETTFVDVASKIPGRIDSIFVDEGSIIKKGTILAKLESKEVDAKLEQARGVMEAAKSKMQMVQKGAREEEKRAVTKLYEQAKEQFDYAGKTWERIDALYKDSVVSAQTKDEVYFKYKAAQAQMEAAEAKYDMVKKGARDEEKTAVEALYHQAENVYNEALAYHQELFIKAPVDGELSKRIVDPGEVINSGYPVFSIMIKDDSYVLLQIREDKFNSINIGDKFTGIIPALNNREENFTITYISPMADFATWRPTNQKGDFDLKTFEIKLKPENKILDLRPGMTVQIKL